MQIVLPITARIPDTPVAAGRKAFCTFENCATKSAADKAKFVSNAKGIGGGA